MFKGLGSKKKPEKDEFDDFALDDAMLSMIDIPMADAPKEEQSSGNFEEFDVDQDSLALLECLDMDVVKREGSDTGNSPKRPKMDTDETPVVPLHPHLAQPHITTSASSKLAIPAIQNQILDTSTNAPLKQSAMIQKQIPPLNLNVTVQPLTQSTAVENHRMPSKLDTGPQIQIPKPQIQQPKQQPQMQLAKQQMQQIQDSLSVQEQQAESDKKLFDFGEAKPESLRWTNENRLEIKRSSSIPGPAGILPKQLPSDLKKKGSKKLPRVPLKSHRTQDFQQDYPAWERMKQENPRWSTESFMIRNIIKTEALNTKIPKLFVIIKEIVKSDRDAGCVFKDDSAMIRGTLHPAILERYESVLEEGSVLELVQVSIFQPTSYSRYLNVTLPNIARIYTRSASIVPKD